MSRGPLPKPSLLKALAGNPSGKPIPRNEPIPPPGDPIAPAWLSERARALWNQLARPLIDTRLATSIDWPLLARYCEFFVEWLEMKDLVAKTGSIQTGTIEVPVRKRKNGPQGAEEEIVTEKKTVYGAEYPHAKALRKLNEVLLKCEDRLGMNPAVRSRITVPGLDTGSPGVNPEDARRREILMGKGTTAGRIGPTTLPPSNPPAPIVDEPPPPAGA